MASTLKDKKVVVVGRGSGLARAITEAARAAGGLTDDDSIAALARRVGAVDHVVSTASARARGMIGDIEPATLAVAITNGAADTLTRWLAVELASIRVNAISPGVIDTGAWDALGEDGKAKLFAERSERNPAGRIGAPEDIGDAAILAMTNTFMTGLTLHVDGGERLT
jgi:hypothetical protein